LNTLPPKRVWNRIYHIATVWDLIREELGKPITTLSIYRSEAYNKCIGGVPGSQHTRGTACDATSSKAKAKDIYEIALAMRREEVFKGGIGLYVRSNFVHVDVRGYNATWGGK